MRVLVPFPVNTRALPLMAANQSFVSFHVAAVRRSNRIMRARPLEVAYVILVFSVTHEERLFDSYYRRDAHAPSMRSLLSF